MDDKESQDLQKVAKIGAGSIGNIALACVLSFALNILLGSLGVPFEVSATISSGLFLAVIFGDPIATWRGERSWRQFAFYFVAGLGLSAIIDLAVLTDAPTSDVPASDVVAQQTTDPDFPWFLLIIFLIIPITFALPLLEKLLRIEKDAPEVTREDLAISAAFPIMMTATMVLQLGIPGALWLIKAPLWAAAGLYLMGICLVVADVAYSPEEDSARDLQDAWGPRPETAEESWANLRKGLGQSFASALFMGSILYISISLLWGQADLADFDDGGGAVLGSLLAFAGLMLGVTLLLIALGCAVTLGFALVLGRLRFRDPMSIVELAERSVGRLFMGGMSWVRPDLPEDDVR